MHTEKRGEKSKAFIVSLLYGEIQREESDKSCLHSSSDEPCFPKTSIGKEKGEKKRRMVLSLFVLLVPSKG